MSGLAPCAVRGPSGWFPFGRPILFRHCSSVVFVAFRQSFFADWLRNSSCSRRNTGSALVWSQLAKSRCRADGRKPNVPLVRSISPSAEPSCALILRVDFPFSARSCFVVSANGRAFIQAANLSSEVDPSRKGSGWTERTLIFLSRSP